MAKAATKLDAETTSGPDDNIPANPADNQPATAVAKDASAEAPAKPRRAFPVQVVAHDIQPAGTKWSSWAVVAHDDHTIEDALHPRYLYNKADHFNVLDYVEIKHPHGDWIVCLDIVRIDNEARYVFSKLRHVFDFTLEGDKQVQVDLSAARVEFMGSEEWGIIDGHHTMKSGFKTRVEAEGYLRRKRRELAGG